MLQSFIFLIMLIYSCVYLNLTFLCNFAYKVKSSIVFFKIFNNSIVYLLMLFCSIVASNNNLSNNFFVFIAF